MNKLKTNLLLILLLIFTFSCSNDDSTESEDNIDFQNNNNNENCGLVVYSSTKQGLTNSDFSCVKDDCNYSVFVTSIENYDFETYDLRDDLDPLIIQQEDSEGHRVSFETFIFYLSTINTRCWDESLSLEKFR